MSRERPAPFDPVERETWEERVARDVQGGAEALSSELLDGVRAGVLSTDRPAAPGEPGAPPFVRGSAARPGWTLVHALRGGDAASLNASAREAQACDADRLWLSREALRVLPDEAALATALTDVTVPVDVELEPLGLAWLGAFARIGKTSAALDPYAPLARDGATQSTAVAWLAELLATAEEGARPWLVDARVHHEAGAGSAMELGAAIATGLDQLRALAELGHPLADAPRRARFAFAAGSDLYVEIAKLRAARLLWSKVLRALGVDGPEQGMQIHAFGSERELAREAHHTNLLRGTAAGLAAAVGGAERVTLATYEPTAHGERLARNTMHLLRYESHLDRVTDAAGGSFHVEELTDALARAAWAHLGAIESEGGMAAALQSGWWAERVAEERARREEALRTGELARVGVHKYAGEISDTSEPAAPTPAPEPGDERAEKAVRDAVKSEARGTLATALRASESSVALLRAELARASETLEGAPLAPFRDADVAVEDAS